MTTGYRVTFDSSLFSPQGADREESHATLQLYLDTLVEANCIIMARRQLPLLYESGVRYQAEPRGHENWQDVLCVLKRKRADCEDLSAVRAAELRKRFLVALARAIFTFWQHPTTLEQRYHCLTQYPVPAALLPFLEQLIRDTRVEPIGHLARRHPALERALRAVPYVHPSARVVEGGLFQEDPSKVLGMVGAS